MEINLIDYGYFIFPEIYLLYLLLGKLLSADNSIIYLDIEIQTELSSMHKVIIKEATNERNNVNITL